MLEQGKIPKRKEEKKKPLKIKRKNLHVRFLHEKRERGDGHTCKDLTEPLHTQHICNRSHARHAYNCIKKREKQKKEGGKGETREKGREGLKEERGNKR